LGWNWGGEPWSAPSSAISLLSAAKRQVLPFKLVFKFIESGRSLKVRMNFLLIGRGKCRSATCKDDKNLVSCTLGDSSPALSAPVRFLFTWCRSNRDVSMQEMLAIIDLVGDCLAVPLSIIAGGFALLQWRKSEDWKRKEFVQQHFEKLQSDIAFRLATGMMDWERKFRLDAFSGENDHYFHSSRENLTSALRHSGGNGLGFSDVEATVRDIFDVFLSRLEMVVDMIESGLLTYEDIKPYLSYWIEYLLKKNKATKWRNDVADVIGEFSIAYGYKCIHRFTEYDAEYISKKLQG
jgi:hypothetical protein